MKRRNRNWIWCVAGGLALTAFAIGCATNPVSGRREFSLVSPQQELAIGKDGYSAVIQEYGAYDGQRLQAYIDSIGKRLAAVSHQPGLDWHFTLLDDATVNAFAMPGGYIYITRGILAHLGSEAQLAGVLGHEIGHVTARHSAQRLTQQQLTGLGLGLASAFSEGFRRYGEAAQTALGLMFLKYGRDDENQADQLGIDYATQAGYDPREIPNTYLMLKRVSDKSGSRLPTFLSSHPDPGDRENRTRALATTAAAGKAGLLIRGPQYTRRLEEVVFGGDPRQGYFEGNRFLHPGMAFEITFPAGWKKQNGREAVTAADANGGAQMQLTTLEAGTLSPAAFVADLERSGKVAGTDGRSQTIGGYPAWIGKLQVTGQDGTPGVLLAAFLRRSDGPMFQILGVSGAAGAAGEEAVFASARSFRALTDPARLQPTPDRVHVVPVARGGAFSQVVSGLGAQALGLEDTSILNNVALDEDVRAGELLKIVKPGRR